MKLLAAVLLALALVMPASAATAQHVIFDTDMGNDVDDALALAMLHAFIQRGEVDLLAVTVSKDNPWAAEYVQMEDEYYGRGGIPVGLVRDGKTQEDGNYVRQVCEMHHRHLGKYAEAVELLRKTLAAEQDGAVSMIQVGFSTNLARLLDSSPDQYSPLNGMDLVKKKVRLLTVMAGNFAEAKGEYNVVTDVKAAAKVFTEWPTPVYFSDFQVGLAVLFPAISIENDFPQDNPVAQAYKAYMKMPYDRPSWDLTTVLYDLRPDRGYFDVSPPGKVMVTNEGLTRFQPAAGGNRYLLKVNGTQAGLVRDACVWLSSQPKDR